VAYLPAENGDAKLLIDEDSSFGIPERTASESMLSSPAFS
jgi:hypothetical protein